MKKMLILGACFFSFGVFAQSNDVKSFPLTVEGETFTFFMNDQGFVEKIVNEDYAVALVTDKISLENNFELVLSSYKKGEYMNSWFTAKVSYDGEVIKSLVLEKVKLITQYDFLGNELPPQFGRSVYNFIAVDGTFNNNNDDDNYSFWDGVTTGVRNMQMMGKR